MEFPGSSSWEFFDVDSYQRAREAAGAPLPAATPQAPSGPAVAGAEDLAGQLADLRLGRAERHRASDAGAALAPRNAPPGIGGSMRLPAQAAAALVGRDNHFHSARRPYVPESSPGGPEPYAAPQPARHSSACASYATRYDPAPRRKGGFMSGLKKGVVKGLKSALGFGGSSNSNSNSNSNSSKDFSSSTRSASSRHSIDSFLRRDSTLRMDPHSPGPELARTVTEEDADHGRVSVHGSPPAEVPVQQPPPASRRRRRNDEDWESARWVAGSAMRARETTLEPPISARREDAHEQDHALIARARAGLAANPSIPEQTKRNNEKALIWLSAWLKQVGKLPMQARLFSAELTLDAWKYVRLGGHHTATAALRHLRDMELSTTGMAEIANRHIRRTRDVPQADRDFIEAALETPHEIRTAQAFSEWLAREELPALTQPIVDDDGVTRAALHTSDMTYLAEAYRQTPGAQYISRISGTLKHLRAFANTGATNVRKRSHHLDIPEVDQRLAARFREAGNAQMLAAAQAKNEPVKLNGRRRTKVDEYAALARAFSDWRFRQGLPTLAAALHDDTLMTELGLFVNPRSSTYRSLRAGLTAMKGLFPSQTPEVAIARIGRDRFVDALEVFAPGSSVADVANQVGADADDLLVLLDAQADDGLTRAGRAMVRTFDGDLRQRADAGLARRQHWVPTAAQGPVPASAATPSSYGPLPTPSGGWPDVHGWMMDLSGPDGTESIFGGLGSLDSDAHRGGLLHHPGSPSGVTQPARTDSAFDGLSSLDAGLHHVDPRPFPSTPAEVTGPERALDPGLAVDGGAPEITSPSPAPAVAPLPTGYVPFDLGTLLAHINGEVGYASGQALNCLVDSILQLARGIRRQAVALPALDHEVGTLRDMLVDIGLAPLQGPLDVYERGNVGALLATNLNLRIQFIQQAQNGTFFIHPVCGLRGPLVHILHTHGHFQPLWPSGRWP